MRETTSQRPYMGFGSFCDPSSPHAEFQVQKRKGAQNRHLVLMLASICREHMRDDHRNYKRVAHVLDHMVSFHICLHYTAANGNHPFHLPRQIATQIFKLCEAIQMHYVYMAEHNLLQLLRTSIGTLCPNCITFGILPNRQVT